MSLTEDWSENLNPQNLIGWYVIFSFSTSEKELKYDVASNAYKGSGDKPSEALPANKNYVWWSGTKWSEEKP